ncbi:hypothetical protein [Streptomyces nanshensis]|uniref:Uncharacterized protein n=1 Tax=Streptomyces nanshensis TaxID=518642 RepID=A0A1E7LAD7_9ACTN|nr:hypothetical protein [Streptomyces nanshensis]OEV13212.1 hypothetical protein AN218_04675 [Streptomyces nanshensis]
MERGSRYPVSVWAPFGARDRLKRVVEAEQPRGIMLRSEPAWRTYGLSRVEAAKVRARRRAELQRRRAEGELLDTQDAVIAWGVRQELRARGWDREWPAAPEAAWDQGKWPGSRDGGFAEKISVRLDWLLVERTVAACWETSREAIEALRRWRDEHPGLVTPRSRPDKEGREQLVGPLAEYERLSAQVTTPGQIWRGGLERGLAHAAASVREAGTAAGGSGDTE